MNLTPNAFALLPAKIVIDSPARISGSVSVPGSKSQTNRILLFSALGDGVSTVTGAMVADDSRQMIGALRALGIGIEPIEASSRDWHVKGCGGDLPDVGGVVLDAGLAGTVMRFVSAVATLAPHQTILTGREPLLARPVGELVKGLSTLGADISCSDDAGEFPPVIVRPSRPMGGQVTVDARRSSQFASAIAAVAPFFAGPTDLHVVGLEASGYFDLTLELMRRRGVQVERTPKGALIGTGQYRALDEQVPGDASSASHIFTIAAATGSRITVENLEGSELQPDYSVLSTLEAFGCVLERHDDGSITVTGPDELCPISADLTSTPDQLPNVAVLAALAPGRSEIRGVGITRFHETDRIQAVENELAKLGIETSSTADSMEILGGSPRPGQTVSTYHDHRLGMAFAALGLAIGRTTVDGAGCVAKTFPDFWDVIESAGAPITRRSDSR